MPKLLRGTRERYVRPSLRRVALLATLSGAAVGISAPFAWSQIPQQLDEQLCELMRQERTSRGLVIDQLMGGRENATRQEELALEKFRTMKARVEGAQCDYEGATNNPNCPAMQQDYKEALLAYRKAQERTIGFANDEKIAIERYDQIVTKISACDEEEITRKEHSTLQPGSFSPSVNPNPDDIYTSGGIILNFGVAISTAAPAAGAPQPAAPAATSGVQCVDKSGKVVAPVKAPAVAPRGNMPATPAAATSGMTCPPGSKPMKREAAASPTSASLDQAPAHIVPVPPAPTHVVPVPASVPAAAVHKPPQPPANVAPASVHVTPQPPTYTGPAIVNVLPTHVHKPGKVTHKPGKVTHTPGIYVSKPPKNHPPHTTTIHQVKPKTVYPVASPGGRPASVYQTRR